jgi:hypothetical protein
MGAEVGGRVREREPESTFLRSLEGKLEELDQVAVGIEERGG